MISIIGTVITCLSLISFGYSHIIALRKERQNLRGIISLVDRIRTRIECFRQPLADIYEDFSCECLDLMGFTNDLKESGLTFALMKNKSSLAIDNDAFALVSEYSRSLGKSYADDQVRLCIDCKEKLERHLEKIEGDLPQKTRLSLTLSAAAAAMTAILFL